MIFCNFPNHDFKSLVETRILLELKSVRLAALRRTEKQLKQIKEAMMPISKKVLKVKMQFRKIFCFIWPLQMPSGNSTLNTFMLKITPEIITNFEKYHVCDDDQALKGNQGT